MSEASGSASLAVANSVPGDYGYNQQQYSTTSYGAQGGAGGGGFMNSGSQEGTSNAKPGYGKDTLRPVTIKQLNDAQQPHPDAEFKVDGTEVTQVTFVGQIRNISQQATHFTYKLDDGTGTIEVKQWIDPEITSGGTESADPKAKLLENAYARVWGRLKPFNNKRHIGAHVIRPVSDYNEVQYHLLEAAVVHLHFTRGPPAGQQVTNGTNGPNAANGQVGAYSDVGADKGRMLPAGLSGGAKRVYNCLHTFSQSNEGLHIQDLAVKLKMELADINKAGDELLNQGLIYTTVDDQTWAILDDL